MENFLYKYRKNSRLIKVLLLFPDVKHIALSSLGFQWVYHLIQSDPDFDCDIGYIQNDKIIVNGSCLERLDYKALFVSISFELNLLNLIKVLKKYNLDKKKEDSPLLIIGGIATTFLNYYLKNLFDVILSGDAELTLPPVLEFIKKNDNNLNELEAFDGIFLRDNNYYKLNYYNKNNYQIPHSVIISDETEFNNSALIEISKSCKNRCNFCLVGNLYGGYISNNVDQIYKIIDFYASVKENYNINKIGLIAATLTNHPSYKDILYYINKNNFKVSFSSVRIEQIDDELLKILIDNENKTLTIAPETASKKLKKIINKYIDNEIIYKRIEKACLYGIKRIKIYFMIGLPEEDISDIDEIINFIKNVREISKINVQNTKYLPEIIIDINPFVPKPFTNFESYDFEDIKILKKKILYIKSKIRKLGRIFVYGESPKYAFLQYQLSNNKLSYKDLLDNYID